MRKNDKLRRVTALGRLSENTFRWDRSSAGTPQAKCLKNLKGFMGFFDTKREQAIVEIERRLTEVEEDLGQIDARFDSEEGLQKASATLEKFEAMAEEQGWSDEDFEQKKAQLFSAPQMRLFVGLGRRKEELQLEVERCEKGLAKVEEFIGLIENVSFGNIERAILDDLDSDIDVGRERPKWIAKLEALNTGQGGDIVGLKQLFELLMSNDDRLAKTHDALLIVERDAEERFTDFVTEYYALIDDKERCRDHLAFELSHLEREWNNQSLGDDDPKEFDKDHYDLLVLEEERRELTLLGLEGRTRQLEKIYALIEEREVQGKDVDGEYKKALEAEILKNQATIEASEEETLGMRDEYLEYSLMIGPVYKAYVELRRNVMRELYPRIERMMTTRYTETETQQMRDEIQEELEETRENWEKAKAQKEEAEEKITQARQVWSAAQKKEKQADQRESEAGRRLREATQEKERSEKKVAEYEGKLKSLQEREDQLKESKASLKADTVALETEKKRLSEANTELDEKVRQFEDECKRLTGSLTEKEGQLARKKEELRGKEDELASKQRELLDTRAELAALEGILKGKTSELQDRRASLVGHQEGHKAESEALARLKEECARLSGDLQQREESLAKKRATFTQEAKAFLEVKAEFDREKAAFSTKEAEYAADLKKHEEQCSKLDAREQSLEERSAELDARSTKIGERESLGVQNEMLTQEVAGLRAANHVLKEDLGEQTAEAGARRLSSQRHQTQIVSLEQSQHALSSQHQAKLAQLQGKSKGLEAQNASLTQELENLQQQLRAATQAKVGVEEELRAATQAKAGVGEELRAANEAKAGVDEELRAANEAKAGVDAELRAANEAKAERDAKLLPFHKIPGRMLWVAGAGSTFVFTAASLAVLATLDTALPAAALFAANPALSVLVAFAAVALIVAVVGAALEAPHQLGKHSLMKQQEQQQQEHEQQQQQGQQQE